LPTRSPNSFDAPYELIGAGSIVVVSAPPPKRWPTTGEDHAPGTVLLGCGHDVQQQIGVGRLDPRLAGARARIRWNMQHRIDTGELGRSTPPPFGLGSGAAI
jgi:hypothetical protein